MSSVTGTVESKLHEAFALQRQQFALLAELKLLREKWDHELDPGPRLIAMRPVEQKTRERLVVLTRQLEKLEEIGQLLYPLAKFSAMQKRPAFWQKVSEPREEKPEETSMAL